MLGVDEFPEAPVLTWDPAGEAHRDCDGPISQLGMVKALVAAATVFEFFASIFFLRIRSHKLIHVEVQFV